MRLGTQDELSIINIRTEVFDSNGSTLRGKAYTCKIEEHLAVALQNGCRVYIRALCHPNMSFMASRAVETFLIGNNLLLRVRGRRSRPLRTATTTLIIGLDYYYYYYSKLLSGNHFESLNVKWKIINFESLNQFVLTTRC